MLDQSGNIDAIDQEVEPPSTPKGVQKTFGPKVVLKHMSFGPVLRVRRSGLSPVSVTTPGKSRWKLRGHGHHAW